MAEHFVRAPHWEWYILGYFFLAGVSGGSYVLATLLRLYGGARHAPVARAGYLIAFPTLVLCPILLTLDLGEPLRFWHMLINTTPGSGGLIFKYWSPMSVGSWALLIYGVFAFVSFLEALGRGGPAVARAGSAGGGVIAIVGSVLGLFVASYTGVLLSVSNQPVWSDTWTLGGLFLASGLSGSAALLAAVAHGRRETEGSAGALERADGYFAVIELVWILIFLITIGAAGTLGRVFGGWWLVLWLLVALGLIPPLRTLAGAQQGRTTERTARGAAILVLVGVLALRAVIIFAPQL